MSNYINSMLALRSIINKADDFRPDGTPTGVYESNTFIYSSSIDSISNLWAGYSYDTGLSNLPICLVMHGWSQTGAQYYGEVTERIASYGYFAISVGMRGRDGASGSRDASSRELYDIFDAINYLKSNFTDKINGDSIVAVGWSGGGGNSLNFASKFPDLCQVTISNFGMSDYGYDLTDGWYYTNPSFATSITDSIGDINDKNLYRARYSVEQITNYKGFLYLFHDVDDATVDVVHSQNIDNALTENYFYSETDNTNNPRWLHSTPIGSAEIIQAELQWEQNINTLKKITLASTGTLKVNGYLITKVFTIWLGDGITESENGKNRSATVDYNTNTREYIVTPLFEGSATDCKVIITQDGITVQQVITSQTTIIIS